MSWELRLVWLRGWDFKSGLLENFLNKEPNGSWLALKWDHGLSAVFKVPFGFASKVVCNNCPVIDTENKARHSYNSAGSSINVLWSCWRQGLDLISLSLSFFFNRWKYFMISLLVHMVGWHRGLQVYLVYVLTWSYIGSCIFSPDRKIKSVLREAGVLSRWCAPGLNHWGCDDDSVCKLTEA